jgi:transcriptional regulator
MRREVTARERPRDELRLASAPSLPLTVERKHDMFFFRQSKGRAVSEKSKGDLLQGTLDMLVLKSLQLGAMHGWGIAERLDQGSKNVLQIGQGSLYPALYRLERQGLIASEWRASENNRRARFYRLTSAGRRRLAEERESWARMSRAVEMVLRMGEA